MATFSQESQRTIVRISEPEDHPVPIGKLGPQKGETSSKPPSWSVAASGQEPRPPVLRPLLIPLQHTRPQRPISQGTSFLHLCNRGEGREPETGSILHSANSFHGSLLQAEGQGLLDVNALAKEKKIPQGFSGERPHPGMPGIAIRKHIGRPPFPACPPTSLLMACTPRPHQSTPWPGDSPPLPEGLTFPIASSFPPAVIKQMLTAH